MRQLQFIIAMVLVIVLIYAPTFSQSAEKKKEAAPSEVKTDTNDNAKTTGTYLGQKKELYQKKAEEKLHRFEDKVNRLYVRAEKKGAKVKEKISRAADDLRKKSESAKNKLKDLKESGVEKWEHARGELDSMIKDLERSYDRVASKFRD